MGDGDEGPRFPRTFAPLRERERERETQEKRREGKRGSEEAWFGWVWLGLIRVVVGLGVVRVDSWYGCAVVGGVSVCEGEGVRARVCGCVQVSRGGFVGAVCAA